MTSSNTAVVTLPTIRACGLELQKADKASFAALVNAADIVARLLGTSPTVELWEQVSSEFRAGYASGRDVTPGASEAAWTKIAGALKTMMNMEKPTATTKDAVRVADKRDADKKAISAAAAQIVKPAEAMARAAELLASGDPVKVKEARILRKAADSVMRDAEKTAQKNSTAEIANARKEAGELLKKVDLKMLRAVIAYLDKGIVPNAPTVGKASKAPKASKAAKVIEEPAPF